MLGVVDVGGILAGEGGQQRGGLINDIGAGLEGFVAVHGGQRLLDVMVSFGKEAMAQIATGQVRRR